MANLGMPFTSLRPSEIKVLGFARLMIYLGRNKARTGDKATKVTGHNSDLSHDRANLSKGFSGRPSRSSKAAMVLSLRAV
jgi:hypothetical protein